jgi:hypothetical protein
MAKKDEVKNTEANAEAKKVSTKPRKVNGGGHILYTVHSKSRGGFITEHMTPEQACETVDYYWNEYRRNVSIGKWKPHKFDMYIIKHNTGISTIHTESYPYVAGSLTESRREAKMRERYGDDYREEEDIENFDSSQYM